MGKQRERNKHKKKKFLRFLFAATLQFLNLMGAPQISFRKGLSQQKDNTSIFLSCVCTHLFLKCYQTPQYPPSFADCHAVLSACTKTQLCESDRNKTQKEEIKTTGLAVEQECWNQGHAKPRKKESTSSLQSKLSSMLTGLKKRPIRPQMNHNSSFYTGHIFLLHNYPKQTQCVKNRSHEKQIP